MNTRMLARRIVARYLQAKPRPFNLYGDNQGDWIVTDQFLMGADRREWDWEALSNLYNSNEWKNLAVDGATEYHRGFLKALREAVRKYPVLLDYILKFDGPWIPLRDLVGEDSPKTDWNKIKFYHGTAMAYWGSISHKGLAPRSMTGSAAGYGLSSSAPQGNPNLVYLTTQDQMAKFAARDAGKATKTQAILLEVHGGLDPSRVGPDEDSGQDTAEGSLSRIGSITYRGVIPPRNIRIVKVLEGMSWIPF